MWLALQQVGAAGYRRMIADDMRLARAMADAVRRLRRPGAGHTGAEHHDVPLRAARSSPGVGDAAVERHLDALNRTLLDRLQRGGEAFVSNAIVGNRYVLRACIVNFHTTREDVQAAIDIAARLGREVDAQLRAT